ncbi:hypothetical protein V8J88_13470 [Massilia sp. W12]|uniref:hypothetical protein n=1 Tax=Massilia sp. W12 TaxID=3126507 RepID=UPI0030D1B02F
MTLWTAHIIIAELWAADWYWRILFAGRYDEEKAAALLACSLYGANDVLREYAYACMQTHANCSMAGAIAWLRMEKY